MLKFAAVIEFLRSVPLPDGRDCLALMGLGLLSYGLHEVYPPAAYIVTGALFLIGSLWSFRRYKAKQ